MLFVCVIHGGLLLHAIHQTHQAVHLLHLLSEVEHGLESTKLEEEIRRLRLEVAARDEEIKQLKLKIAKQHDKTEKLQIYHNQIHAQLS